MTRGEARTAKGTIAVTSVRTSTSEVSDDGMNDGLLGETKRLGERRTAVEGVATTADTVVIDTAKELSWLIGVNPSTQAAGTGEDAGAVSTTVAAAARASRPWGRCSGGKGLEKPACELEPRNGSSAARMAARDITKGRKSAGRGAREGSIPKGERE